MTRQEGDFKRVFDLSGDRLIGARSLCGGAIIVLKRAAKVHAAPSRQTIINPDTQSAPAAAGTVA